MKIRRSFKRKSARIEMVPLIDIIFLLLVFFLYAMLSMAVHRGMNLDLPVSADPVPSEQSPLSVSVDVVDGRAVIYLNKEEIPLPELERRLRQAARTNEVPPEVLLFADKTVSYQQLYDVLDRISRAGISAISLQAEQKR